MLLHRRRFLEIATLAINGLIGLVVAVPVVGWLIPFRRIGEGSGTPIRISRLRSLTVGRPTRVVVKASRRDKFTQYPPGPIGAVWLLRESETSETVRAFQSVCPHLGCSVGYSVDRQVFACPCHASEFDLQGVRRFGPSPRDMDELECRITDPDEAGDRWVEVGYEEFRTGVSTKQRTA